MGTAYSPFPDIEAVCRQALADAGVCGGRVYSTIPAKVTKESWPLAIVRRLGGTPAIRQRLDAARIQVDVWGGTQAEARDEADAARVALHELEGQAFTRWDAFVTAVDDELGLNRVPDGDTGRERYVFACRVYAHHYEPKGS